MKLALVGRPNVGKSALFNRICKQRISIVDDMEGVTRDRIYSDAEYLGRSFELIDTGGIHFEKNIPFCEEVKRQALIAIEEADGIILVVDARVGVQQLDVEVAKILLKTKKPVILAVNKIDDLSLSDLVFDFYELGIEKMIPVSAEHGLHIAELLEEILQFFPVAEEQTKEKQTKVAIIGRVNVGKSTLLNAILKEDRSIVSDLVGTTRDAIDVTFQKDNESFVLIDTAGIRKKNKEKEVVEKFAAIRTFQAIERADICVVVIDVQEGLTTQEKRILSDIQKKGRGCVIFLNKWDLAKNWQMEEIVSSLYRESPFIKHCPIIIGSAKQNRNTEEVFKQVILVKKELEKKMPTPELNRFVDKCFQTVHPPMIMGKRLRVYYMTQKSSFPPRFILFVNNPKLMTKAYKSYLINSFRQAYSFLGCPIEFSLRGKKATTGGPKKASVNC